MTWLMSASGIWCDLIRVMAQRDRIPLLQERCRQLRPSVDWPDIPEEEVRLFLQTPERPHDLSPKERKKRQKQLVLLAKVKRLWVSGVLRDTTRDATLLDLNQTRADELLDQPWYEMVETAVYDKPALSVHKNILDTFLETGHALLILGGPGTGKTTTLLQLAQSLVQVAERNPMQSIPVILNLSFWEEKREETGDWIVEELTVMYQIPREIGREWLNNDDLLLLLDGLDEVTTRYRADCARAINRFRNKHGLTGMAICCRTLDYQEMGVTLKLGGAILLQTLSPEQVETYLSSAGPALAGLSQIVKQDPVLREMAQFPLMLNVMRLAYSDMSGELLRIEPGPESDPVPEIDKRHRHLFDAYVKRMLQRAGSPSSFWLRTTFS